MCFSVVKYRTTVVYTGNMTGKDYWIAGIVLWWLLTRPNSLCVISGPSQTVLGSVTWKEIRRAIEASPFSFFFPRVTCGVKASPAVVEVAPGWHALGFSTTSIERLSGQHAAHTLGVIEEASGVDDFVFDTLDSLGYDRLVAIGNPIRAEGKFVELIRQAGRDRADNIPPRLAVNAIQIPSTESPHAHLEKSPVGLADATWLQSMARKHGEGLWWRSHVQALIPDVDAERLIDPTWLDFHSKERRPPVPPTHPVNFTRRIACDLAEGVGRDSTCVLVLDDWGLLEVVLSNDAGLPEAAVTIARLSKQWNVPHERITYDKLGIGRNFPNHLARHGITTAVPYAGEGRPQDPSSYTNLRSEAGFKLRNRLDPRYPIPLAEKPSLHRDPSVLGPRIVPQRPFYFCPGLYYSRLVDELQPLTYSLVGRKTKLLPKDDWSTILGHSPDVADALIQSMILS